MAQLVERWSTNPKIVEIPLQSKFSDFNSSLPCRYTYLIFNSEGGVLKKIIIGVSRDAIKLLTNLHIFLLPQTTFRPLFSDIIFHNHYIYSFLFDITRIAVHNLLIYSNFQEISGRKSKFQKPHKLTSTLVLYHLEKLLLKWVSSHFQGSIIFLPGNHLEKILRGVDFFREILRGLKKESHYFMPPSLKKAPQTNQSILYAKEQISKIVSSLIVCVMRCVHHMRILCIQ